MRTIHFVTALVISLAGVAGGQQPRQAGAPLSEPRTWSTPWDKTRPRDPYADQRRWSPDSSPTASIAPNHLASGASASASSRSAVT